MSRPQSIKQEETTILPDDLLEVDSTDGWTSSKAITYRNFVKECKKEVDNGYNVTDITYDETNNVLNITTVKSVKFKHGTMMPLFLPKGLPLIKANVKLSFNGNDPLPLYNSLYYNFYNWTGLDQGTLQAGLNFITYDVTISGYGFTVTKPDNKAGVLYYRWYSLPDTVEKNVGYVTLFSNAEFPVEQYPCFSKYYTTKFDDINNASFTGYKPTSQGGNTELGKTALGCVDSRLQPSTENSCSWNFRNPSNATGDLSIDTNTKNNAGLDYNIDVDESNIYWKRFGFNGSNTTTLTFTKTGDETLTRRVLCYHCIGL